MNLPVHVATMPAGMNPAGLWVRVCTWAEVVDEYPLGRAGIIDNGDVLGAIDRLRRRVVNERVWSYIYDGDTGECIATLMAEPGGDDE